MARLDLLFRTFAVAAVAGCTPAASTALSAPEGGDSTPLGIADRGNVTASSTGSTKNGVASGGIDAPPHRFSPQAHSGHGAPPIVATPPLTSLPRLIVRPQCLTGGAPQPMPFASGPMHRSRIQARGSSPAPRPVYKQSASPAGSASGAGAPPPASAPAAPPASVAAEASSRDDEGGAVADRAPAPRRNPKAKRRAPRSDSKDADKRRDEPDSVASAEPAAEPSVPMEMAEREDASDRGYHDWGAAIYLSNDDTMSLSSAQRVIYAIDNFLPLPKEHIRPHELLNYFSFDVSEPGPGDDFAVRPSLAKVKGDPGIYSLGLSISGRTVDKRTRRNAALSLVVDRSGSMSAEGRMEYLKRGLLRMTDELKRGDLVNLVLFDHMVCVPVENYVVGRDDTSVLRSAIQRLHPRGSTDVHSGLTTGYRLADAAYRPNYSNRVVVITDALANTGVTDPRMMAMVSRYYDSRRIRLSGIGVGREFNDDLLDRLTEAGKGSYVFLGSEAEVDAVFGERFVSLIETTANDVHFRLHLPPSLRMNVFYGEESSTHKRDVQAIHYSANTAQLLLSDLMARDGRIREDDQFMLSAEYENPETGEPQREEYAYTLGEAMRDARNVQKGHLVMTFIDGLAEMASRPTFYRQYAGGWDDEEGFDRCERGSHELATLASGIDDDPEVRRLQGLWDKYCARFARPSRAVRRGTPPRPGGSWPGAR